MCRLDVVVVPGDENAGVVDVKLNETVFRSLVGAESTDSAGAEYRKYIGELNSAVSKWIGQYPALKNRRLVFSAYQKEQSDF